MNLTSFVLHIYNPYSWLLKAITPISWSTNGSSGAIVRAWLKNRSASLKLLVSPCSSPMYRRGRWQPFISWDAVKYATIAWSCSFSAANEWPNASQAGPYTRSSVVALLGNKTKFFLQHNSKWVYLTMHLKNNSSK